MTGISGFWDFKERSIAQGLIIQPQPLESADGRYLIVYSGEIYNSEDIRCRFEKRGVRFKDNSDAEVILASILTRGLDDTLRILNGVFAFALWDRKEERLYLARDKIGVKPLYFGIQKGVLFFASQLKSIVANKLFKPEINRDTLALFFRHNYVTTPYCIYRDLSKLQAGHYAIIERNQNISLHCYWDLKRLVEQGIKDPIDLTEKETVSELEKLLLDAVAKRVSNNGQTGIFFSGGIDSSLIVALMQRQSAKPVKTFSLGFSEASYNEAVQAKAVAQHLGVEHRELYVTPDDARQIIPKLADMYDEPFSDSSQVPTFLVSQFSRKYVAVTISGDGGDELFGGYNRYFWANKIWNRTEMFPSFIKFGFGGLIRNISPAGWDNLFERFAFLLPSVFKQQLPGDKLYKLADILESSSPDDLYMRLVSHWRKPTDIVLNSKESKTILADKSIKDIIPNFVDRIMYFDLMTYLPDDGLVKVDRAAMAAGLKVRSPLLDHRIVEFSKRLPLSFKIRDKKSKWILRQILHKYVPPELVERPKMGFGLPIDSWLRGPLKDWAEELLDEKKIKMDGFLNPQPIRKLWQEHLSGRRNWQYLLWDVLMFQNWKEKWM